MTTATANEVLAEKPNNAAILKHPLAIAGVVIAVVCGLVVPMFSDNNEISIEQYQSLNALVTTYSGCPVLASETASALRDKKVSNAEFKKILAVSAPCTNPVQVKALTDLVAKH